MPGNIWVVAEHWRGSHTDATFELLALGRELADALGVDLEAVMLGNDVGGLTAELGAADRVLSVDGAALSEPIGEVTSSVLAGLASERGPAAVLVPITNVSWDLLGLLPSRLGASLVNSCSDVRVVDGRIEASSLMYGGKMDALVSVGGETAVLGILPGVRSAEAGRGAGSPEVEEIAVDLAPGVLKLVEYREPDSGDVDLTQQEVLVAVGRGIESDANIEVAEELAEALGGAVCGSRPVIDQGWLPLARQVGKSGVTVKPRFYLAAGISGAPEHVEGMKDTELIVAVNTDPDAPIFGAAHYGVVGDATEILEALVLAVEERKG